MPLFNGMDTAKEIRQYDRAVKTVFLTSSPEFALKSYDVKASGYLLKTTSGYQKLYFHEIEYAEAQNKKVLFHLRSGQTIESPDSFHFFEEQLTPEDGFFKCHRSYLVYLPNVAHFTTSEIISQSGKMIPIARGYSKSFKEAYFARMF